MGTTTPRTRGTMATVATALVPLTLNASALWAATDVPERVRLTLDEAATQPETAPAPSGFDSDLTGDWWGQRQRLQDSGLSIGATLTLEAFKNFRGGIDTAHAVGASTFDLNLTLDTEKMLQWHGGTFYVDLEDHAFRNPSTALVGDLQVFDKQNGSPYLQVFELWYQQKLLNDTVRIKVGKVDANTEFSIIDNGLSFLSSSTQVSPTIFMFPTTPDPMPSLDVFYTPNDAFFASFGASYANRTDRFGELVDNTARVQPTKDGAFLIGETGFKWHQAPLLNLAGNVKVGLWDHTGTFTRFDGTPQHGTFGYYAILNQTLWQPAGEPDTGRGVRAFFEYGGTQEDINAVDRHIGGGITWTGPLAARPNDVLGFSPQYAHITSDAGLAHPFELAMEGFYQWQLTPWALLQPDIQYIVHPGGVHADAVVVTLRLQVSF